MLYNVYIHMCKTLETNFFNLQVNNARIRYSIFTQFGWQLENEIMPDLVFMPIFHANLSKIRKVCFCYLQQNAIICRVYIISLLRFFDPVFHIWVGTTPQYIIMFTIPRQNTKSYPLRLGDVFMENCISRSYTRSK